MIENQSHLSNLVCAVLQSGAIQPAYDKIAAKVLAGNKNMGMAGLTLDQWQRITIAYDLEVVDRAINMALILRQRIGDVELSELQDAEDAARLESIRMRREEE